MKESQLLGTLLPAHPDFLPIERAIREKYNLPEISPDDDPITELYLSDDTISLQEFRKDIEHHLRANLSFLPPEILKPYLSLSGFSKTQHKTQFLKQIDSWPDDVKNASQAILKFVDQVSSLVTNIVDPFINSIVYTLYIYLLTGEAQEIPTDWISKVITLEMFNEKMVWVMAGPMANPDALAYQFREEFKKTFGKSHPKVTNTATSTAYYLALRKARKPWNFIVEEYIRLNKFKLPRDRSSERFAKTWLRYEQRLKKRMQRTEKIFNALIGDKKQ